MRGLFLVLCASLLTGCETEPSPGDGGRPPPGDVLEDAGIGEDAGLGEDAGPGGDSGVPPRFGFDVEGPGVVWTGQRFTVRVQTFAEAQLEASVSTELGLEREPIAHEGGFELPLRALRAGPGRVELRFIRPSGDRVEGGWNVEVLDPRRVSNDPEDLGFGTVGVEGGTAEITLDLSPGTSAARGESLRACPEGPICLGPEGRRLRFRPRSVGPHAATLLLQGPEGTRSVPISGRGAATALACHRVSPSPVPEGGCAPLEVLCENLGLSERPRVEPRFVAEGSVGQVRGALSAAEDIRALQSFRLEGELCGGGAGPYALTVDVDGARLRLEGQVAPPTLNFPAQIELGRVPPVARWIALPVENTGGASAEVRAILDDGRPILDAARTLAPGATETIALRVSVPVGRFERVLTVETGHETRHQVTLRGEGLPSQCALETESVRFGVVGRPDHDPEGVRRDLELRSWLRLRQAAPEPCWVALPLRLAPPFRWRTPASARWLPERGYAPLAADLHADGRQRFVRLRGGETRALGLSLDADGPPPRGSGTSTAAVELLTEAGARSVVLSASLVDAEGYGLSAAESCPNAQGLDAELTLRRHPSLDGSSWSVAGLGDVQASPAGRSGVRVEDLSFGANLVEVQVDTPLGAVIRRVNVWRGPGVDQLDRFRTEPRRTVDLSVIVDTSPSRTSSLTATRNIAALARYLEVQSFDARLSFAASGGSPAAPLRTGSGELERAVEVFEQVLLEPGPGLEQPLLTARRLLADHARQGAFQSVVVLTDEDDRSPGSLEDLITLSGVERLAISSIVYEPFEDPSWPCEEAAGAPARRLRDMVDRAGGVVGSLCSADWSRALGDFGEGALFRFSFHPSREPDPASLEVSIDGRPVAPTSAGGTVNWTFDPDEPAVIFAPIATPEPNSEVELRYVTRCE